MDISRRGILKIGGGIFAFSSGATGVISFMQSPAGAVNTNFQITTSEDTVETPDGELDELELTLTEYTIEYSNLTITDRENAKFEFSISADVFVGSELVLAGTLFQDVTVPIENHSDFHNLLNQDEIDIRHNLIQSLEGADADSNSDGDNDSNDSTNTTNRIFGVEDGTSSDIEVSIRPSVSVSGLSDESTERVESGSEELERTVVFSIQNEETNATSNISGTIDAQ